MLLKRGVAHTRKAILNVRGSIKYALIEVMGIKKEILKVEKLWGISRRVELRQRQLEAQLRLNSKRFSVRWKSLVVGSGSTAKINFGSITGSTLTKTFR